VIVQLELVAEPPSGGRFAKDAKTDHDRQFVDETPEKARQICDGRAKRESGGVCAAAWFAVLPGVVESGFSRVLGFSRIGV
jgi:hypothetical protein